ncbi:glycosyl hydrolase 5 family protein-like [Euphorbia lathyris]|uniref:glycosyl hydrolase 5 family protein-like n=1 Tax=Euphorbia lathyris TaxID=212925 RepID=UPI00331316C5
MAELKFLKFPKSPILFLSIFILSTIPISSSLPLSTKGRWIIDDQTHHRTKLICVNWPSHVETMLAEGLHEQPLKKLVSILSELKYNCVRFTYATYMWTRFSSMTVSESLDSYNLTEAKSGIYKYNPCFLKKTLVQAYESVVVELGKKGIMVILDNHVSKPTWCCDEHDGNGFFGDKYFDPQEWLLGLTKVAHHFKDHPQVIGITTRNELRGPKSNPETWYKYILKGATSIHKTNPKVLIFASGISFATDLSFLKTKTLGTNFNNKLVYDAHWYSWGGSPKSDWEVEFLNDVCHTKTQHFINKTGFTPTLKVNPVPLFIGEFGLDQSLLSKADDHYLSCLLTFLTDFDLDWGLWAWQGSYYFRENQVGMEETFGIMDYHWNRVRNVQLQNRLEIIKRVNIGKVSNFEYLDWGLWAWQGSYYFRENQVGMEETFGIMEYHWNRVRNVQLQNKLEIIKRVNIDPASRYDKSYILFHPQSGTCIHTDTKKEIYTSTCNKVQHHFTYSAKSGNGNGSPIKLKGTNQCIQAIGEGKSPIISTNCTVKLSLWKLISSTRLHISTTDESGNHLCLQKESPYTSKIVTNKCILTHVDPQCDKDWQKDPTTQWFKLVRTNLK